MHQPAKFLEKYKVPIFHAALVLLLVVYVLFGAYVFHRIEGDEELVRKYEEHEQKLKAIQDVHQLRENFLHYTIHENPYELNQYEELAKKFNEVLSTSLAVITENGVEAGEIDSEKLQSEDGTQFEIEAWNSASSMLFAFTAITTIGYGHVYLSTTAGQMFCIIYAIFGIPLNLIVLADIGMYCLDGTVYLVKKCKRLYIYSATFSYYMHDVEKQNPEKLEKIMEESDREYSKGLHLACLICIYLVIGATILPFWEKWTYFEGIYFGFTTVTTIGFGDIVPSNFSLLLIFTVTYIAIGLGITAMAIEHLANLFKKVHYLGAVLSNAADVVIWFGSKTLRVGTLVVAVGQTFDIPQDEIDAMDLDNLVDNACAGVMPADVPEVESEPEPEPEPEEPEEVPSPPPVSEKQLSKALGLQVVSEMQIETMKTPKPEKVTEPYHNDFLFYLAKTTDIRRWNPKAIFKCRHCRTKFLEPERGRSEQGIRFMLLVHWERFMKRRASGEKYYSNENELKPVYLHPWFQCVATRYPYFHLGLLEVDKSLYDILEDTMRKFLLEQLGIENVNLIPVSQESYKIDPTSETVESKITEVTDE